MHLVNKCITVKKGHNILSVSRKRDTNNATLFGKCRTTQTVFVTVDRPASFLGYALAEYLAKHGISIKGDLIEGHLAQSSITEMVVIATDRTSIGSVISECNQRSLNLATGQVGTLKKSGRFREKIYKGKVFAKTGYISGVWILGGYCQNSAGKWLAFSMLVNKGVSPRKTMDDIVKVMMQ